MTPNEQTAKLQNIFLPYAARRLQQIISKNGRFVHYTSAANALSIIKSRRIWMRNTTCMSDYREVRYGFDAGNRYFSNKSHSEAFASALNACYEGVGDEIVTLFNQWWQNTQLQTYITSISEHRDREDLHGRLSMWRAFGGDATARVALVIKLKLTPNTNIALQLMLNPVAYFTDQEFKEELDAVVRNIREERAFLCGLGRAVFVTNVSHARGSCRVLEARGVPRRTGMAHHIRANALSFILNRVSDGDRLGPSRSLCTKYLSMII